MNLPTSEPKLPAPEATSFASEPLMRFRNLRKSFGGVTVLDGVSGEIHSGEVIFLRGDNGSGKTTLLNILSGCLEPDSGELMLRHNGQETHFIFPRSWRRTLNPWNHFTPEYVARHGVSRVWQDIRLFGSLDLADNIAASDPGTPDSPWSALFRHRRADRADRKLRAHASARLDALNLSGRDSSSGDRISLGQSKRVAISRALAAKGRILLLDEPLSGLDTQGITEVVLMLQKLAESNNMALIVVEHALNSGPLIPLVNRVWQLTRGSLSSLAGNNGSGNASAETFNRFWENPEFNTEYQVVHQPLERGARLTRLTRKTSPPRNEKQLLRIENLVVSRGSRIVLGHDGMGQATGLSLSIYEGEIAILEAPNGWGKTSLFDYICGTSNVNSSGSCHFLGRDISRKDAGISKFAELGGSALPSDARLFPSLTATEIGKLHDYSHDLSASKRAAELSGGELRKLALQIAIRSPYRILDEPLRGLDIKHGRSIIRKIVETNSSGFTLCLEPSALN